MQTELSDHSLQKRQQLGQVITDDLNAMASLKKPCARVKWSGGFKFEAYAREHSFLLDEPYKLERVDGANPVERLLFSLGCYYVASFVFSATKRGIKPEDAEVVLEGNLDDILAFFGLKDKGDLGSSVIRAKLYARTRGERKIVGDIWKETVADSPAFKSLARDVRVVPEIDIIK